MIGYPEQGWDVYGDDEVVMLDTTLCIMIILDIY